MEARLTVIDTEGSHIMELHDHSIAWMIAGGVAYTAGTAFYHARRLPYAHAVWHLFVLTGSVCHGVAVGVQLT